MKVELFCNIHNCLCKGDIVKLNEKTSIAPCIKCREIKKEEKRLLERPKEKERYIHDSNLKYNNKYNYSLVDYRGYSKKVKIICPEHGVFEQSFRSHLVETTFGCQQCGAENSNGYGRSAYINKCNGRKAKLYLVRFYDSEEEFYKIGITVQDIKERFKKNRRTTIVYDVEVIDIYEEEAGVVWDIENKIHSELRNSEYHYEPKNYFEGATECYRCCFYIKEYFNNLIKYKKRPPVR